MSAAKMSIHIQDHISKIQTKWIVNKKYRNLSQPPKTFENQGGLTWRGGWAACVTKPSRPSCVPSTSPLTHTPAHQAFHTEYTDTKRICTQRQGTECHGSEATATPFMSSLVAPTSHQWLPGRANNVHPLLYLVHCICCTLQCTYICPPSVLLRFI